MINARERGRGRRVEGGVGARGLSLRRGEQGFMSISAGNYSKHRPFMGWLVVDAGERVRPSSAGPTVFCS